jgi:hypothetical protein
MKKRKPQIPPLRFAGFPVEFSGRKTFPRKVRGTADPLRQAQGRLSAAPDFLLSPMGSAKLMRLSLMKAANEVIFGAA